MNYVTHYVKPSFSKHFRPAALPTILFYVPKVFWNFFKVKALISGAVHTWDFSTTRNRRHSSADLCFILIALKTQTIRLIIRRDVAFEKIGISRIFFKNSTNRLTAFILLKSNFSFSRYFVVTYLFLGVNSFTQQYSSSFVCQPSLIHLNQLEIIWQLK